MSVFDTGNILDDPVGELRVDAPDTPAPEAETVEETEAPADVAETASDRPRNEKGQFVAKDDPDIEKFLAKYDGDITKALKGAAEQSSLVGRLGQELGELRSQVEQLPRQQQQYPADLIESDPSAVAQQLAVQSFQSGQDPEAHPAYKAVMREWYDQDPYEAAQFERTLDRVRFQAEMEQRTMPVQQTLRQQQEQQAIMDFARRNPDIPEYADQIQQLAAQNPVLGRLLESEDPTEKIGALGVLYQLAKGSSPSVSPEGPDTKQDEARAASARAQAQEAEQAKAAAAVVTAANTNTGEPPGKPLADQIWEAWGEHDIGRLRNS